MLEAKIECVIQRDLYYRGKSYKEGDIFFYNPNNREQRIWFRSKRFIEEPEENYDYICLRDAKELNGSIYNKGDVVDLSGLDKDFKTLLIKRGYLKKSLKKKESITTYYYGDKSFKTKEELDEYILKQDKFEKINYNNFAKKYNLKYKDLKDKCKKELNIDLPNMNKTVDKEMFEKITKILTKED